MEYCIDANVLIQAKNLHYHFDICPGFWKWLENGNGEVGSIHSVYRELDDGNDRLKDWANNNKETFFFSNAGSDIQNKFSEISDYVNTNYESAESALFLSKADPWLIAYAAVHGCTIVTHERYSADARKVLIPVIARQFGVVTKNCYEMLLSKGACFVLQS